MTDRRLNVGLQIKHIACPTGSITIIGGVIADKNLVNWLQQWDLQRLPWQFWEWVNAIWLDYDQPLPSDMRLLERGRMFGDGGDLSLRRDGNDFRWHFVGPSNVQTPATPGTHDFWQSPNAPAMLYAVEQQALLCGVWDGASCWYDDRIGQANVRYPAVLRGHQCIYVRYREYLDHGQVAFVWMYDLHGG